MILNCRKLSHSKVKRQSPRGALQKKIFLEILLNSQENTYWSLFLLILQIFGLQLYQKETPALVLPATLWNFSRHLQETASESVSCYLLDVILTMFVSYQSEIFFVLRNSWSAIKSLAHKEHKINFVYILDSKSRNIIINAAELSSMILADSIY